MPTGAFEGKHIVLAGRFTTSTAEFARELEAQGAQITRHISSLTDFMITGTRVGRDKPKRARGLGINILTEEEARALMRGEQVEIHEVGQRGDTSLDALMGQARSVLDKPMLVSTWQEIVALVDACHPSQQEPLVHYFEGHLRTWQDPATRAHALRYVAERVLQGDDSEDLRQSLYFLGGRPHQSLCRAPAHWIGEMMQLAPSSKYRLVHTLDLMYVRASRKKIAEALTHPELQNLDRLSLPSGTSPNHALLDVLFERAAFSTITYLCLGSLSMAQARRFKETISLHIVPHTLDLFGYGTTHMNEREESTVAALAHAPMFGEVETLVINNAAEGIRRFMRELLDHDLMPKRRRLIWDMFGPDVRDFRSILPMLGPTEELHLSLMSYGTGKWSGWSKYLATPLPESVHTLDLSSLGYRHENLPQIGSISSLLFAPDKLVARVCSELCESKLLTHIKSLRLGALYYDARIKDTFETHRPDLELTP